MEKLLLKYPHLNVFRELIPDDILEREIEKNMDKFESDLERAKKNIPSLFFEEVFPAEILNESITLQKFFGHLGNLQTEPLCKICLIVKFKKPDRILELGTYNGMTTLNMALNAPKECITYTLDLPETGETDLPISEIDKYVSRIYHDKFKTKTGSYFNERADLNIKQLYGDSATFDFSKLYDKFDIIFIDAAHDYEHKRIDTENAFKYISEKGIIIWDNYADIFCPEVTSYFADISNKYKFIHLAKTNLLVYLNN